MPRKGEDVMYLKRNGIECGKGQRRTTGFCDREPLDRKVFIECHSDYIVSHADHSQRIWIEGAQISGRFDDGVPVRWPSATCK